MAAKLAWQRLLRRVAEKASPPLRAEVLVGEPEAWVPVAGSTVSVAADVDGVGLRVVFTGATQAGYELVALTDWLDFGDPEVYALRLAAPGDKKARVCPVRISEAAKANPFDTSGPAFSVMGPCYVGLTKERFAYARVGAGGLEGDLAGVKVDGRVAIVVSDQRLLVVTAPTPRALEGAAVRADSAR
jgi:hypothetical protein